MGKPDVVFEMQESAKVPGEGVIEHEYFYIPTNFTEPKWIQAIEIRPGNREVVHHALAFYKAQPDVKARAAAESRADGAPLREATGLKPQRRDQVPNRLLATHARPGPTRK